MSPIKRITKNFDEVPVVDNPEQEAPFSTDDIECISVETDAVIAESFTELNAVVAPPLYKQIAFEVAKDLPLDEVLVDVESFDEAENRVKALINSTPLVKHVIQQVPEDEQRFIVNAFIIYSFCGNYLLNHFLDSEVKARILALGQHGIVYSDGVGSIHKLLYKDDVDAEAAQRIYAEGTLTQKVSEHENIASIRAIIRDPEGRIRGIITEEIVGRDLRDLIYKTRDELPLPLEFKLHIFMEIVDAVAHAHQKEVIHRDLKPENIMISDKGVVSIIDWGIGKDLLSKIKITKTGTTVGTPQYMAPEQLFAKKLGPWTDVYALGIILYELLTDNLPYDCDVNNLAELFPQIAKGDFPEISHSDLPPEVASIITKALSTAPENRYRSATEMQQDLNEFCQQAISFTGNYTSFFEQLFTISEQLQTFVKMTESLELDEVSESLGEPVIGTRRTAALIQTNALLFSKLSQEIPAAYVERPQTLEEISNIGDRFYEHGDLILSQGNQKDANMFLVVDGKVKLFVDVDGERVHLMTLGPGAVIGGGEITVWKDRWKCPSPLFSLEVEGEYLPQQYSAQKRFTTLFPETLTLEAFIHNHLAHEDPAWASDIIRHLNALEDGSALLSYSLQHVLFKEKNPELKALRSALACVARLIIHNSFPFKKGARISSRGFPKEAASFHVKTLLPALQKQTQSVMPSFSPEELSTIALHAFDTVADTLSADTYTARFEFSEKDILPAAHSQFPTKKSPVLKTQELDVAELQVSAAGITLLGFLKHRPEFAITPILSRFLDKKHNASFHTTFEELSDSHLVEGSFSLVAPTLTGFLAQEHHYSPELGHEIDEFLVHHFIDSSEWFLAFRLIESLWQQQKLGKKLYKKIRKSAEKFLENDFDAFSHISQQHILKVLLTLFPEEKNLKGRILLKHIAVAHQLRNFTEIVRTAHHYFSEHSEALASPSLRDDHLQFIHIYLEALADLEQWEAIVAFTDQHGEKLHAMLKNGLRGTLKTLFKPKLSEVEKKILLEFASNRARVQLESSTQEERNSKSHALINEMQRYLEEEILPHISVNSIHPTLLTRFFLMLQRLSIMAVKATQDKNERQQLLSNVVDYGVPLLEQPAADPIVIQPIVMNTGLVLRSLGSNLEALRYFEKGAINSRGLARCLIDSSEILNTLRIGVDYSSVTAEQLDELHSVLQFIQERPHFTLNRSRKLLEDLITKTQELWPETIDEDTHSFLTLGLLQIRYALNSRAVSEAMRVGLPYEIILARANCFDSQFKLLEAMHEFDIDYLSELNLEVHDVLEDLLKVSTQLDAVFERSFKDSFKKNPPLDKVLEFTILRDRFQLIEWSMKFARNVALQGAPQVAREFYETLEPLIKTTQRIYAPLMESFEPLEKFRSDFEKLETHLHELGSV